MSDNSLKMSGSDSIDILFSFLLLRLMTTVVLFISSRAEKLPNRDQFAVMGHFRPR